MKKAFLLIFLLTATFGASAQKPYAAFNHIAIMVTDASKSAAFYIKWFHLDTLKSPFPGRTVLWLSLGGDRQLHIITGTKEEVTVSKINHIAFSVASLDDFIITLKKGNISYGDIDGHAGVVVNRPDGVKQIYLHDPDGYLIEVNNAP